MQCDVCDRAEDYVSPETGQQGHEYDCPIALGL